MEASPTTRSERSESVPLVPEPERDPNRILQARTDLVDSLVRDAAAKYLSIGLSLSVAAVGGYGRRELFPYSDIDLLIILDNELDIPRFKEPLSEFLRVLWDSGLRISHSVRTIAECSHLHEQNAELHISLLDLRFLWGNEDLFGGFSRELKVVFEKNALGLSRRTVELARIRHGKFNNTVYHLEPNIKEAPGGIRDIHALRWLLQLNPTHEPIRESVAELDSAVQFLFALRCMLHMHASRDNNLLSFEMQDEAARVLPPEPTAPETWMRFYFQHARRIFQSTLRALEDIDSRDTGLVRQFRDWRSRLSNSDFTIARERVLLRNPANTLSSSESLIQLFTFVGRHGIQLSWDAKRRIRAEQQRLGDLFRATPPSWNAWRDLLSQPHTALSLQEMQEACVLFTALPGWASIDSLVVRDFYHRYTVDEHTLVAVQAIDNLINNPPGTPPRLQRLAAEEEDIATLRLGLLLHDLGKGTNPGDHVRGSLETADTVFKQLRVPEAKQGSIRFLIEHHLDLSLVMNGRDLDDPATARFLTSRIGTQEDLRRLTLLTYADISAVNPTTMSPWRLEQLWRVYSLGLEQLTRELATDRIHEAPEPGAGSSQITQFLEGFPKRYLRTHTREQIERHLALSQKSKREGVAVEITREYGAYLVTVLAHDEQGLFAKVSGALASFGLNIIKAEAASNAEGCILELIRFTDPLRSLELNPSEVNRLQWTIECVVRHTIEVADLLKRRRRISRPTKDATIIPTVRFNNEASDAATLVEFVGEDRPGLVYELASSIASTGCNIEVAMIDTEAHKALDVFYITVQGGKLDENQQATLQAELVRAASQPN